MLSRAFRASAPGIPRIAYAGPSVSEWSSYSLRNRESRPAHPCKQSRRRLHARDGRNVLTPSNLTRSDGTARFGLANTGHAVGVDFPADQTLGRERRSPFYARALHPSGCGHERGRCLAPLSVRSIRSRHTLLEALSTITKLLALCGPGRWQKHRARAGSTRPLLGWKLRAESGAPKQARKESGALATVPEERTR